MVTYHLFYGERFEPIVGHASGVLCVSSEATVWLFQWISDDEMFAIGCPKEDKESVEQEVSEYNFEWMETIVNLSATEVWNKCLDYQTFFTYAFNIPKKLTSKEFLKLVEMRAFL